MMGSANVISHAGTGLALTLLLGLIPASLAASASESTPASMSARGTVAAQARMAGPDGLGIPGVDYVENEILVTFRQSASDQASRNAVQARGDSIGSALDKRPSMARVRIGDADSVGDAVMAYRQDPNVEHVQPNFIYRAMVTPDDPAYDNLWGLENNGQTVNGPAGTAGRDIGAPAAWDMITDCSSKRIAVLDGGVNYKHGDLAANMWSGASNSGRDFVDTNDDDPLPDAGNQHGSHVAGTIGAIGDNSAAMSGVCWQADLMSVRVLGPNGTGFTSDIIEGIDYAINNGADLINMSLGQGEFDQGLEDALANARDNGVLVVVAAGNNDDDLSAAGSSFYPCSFDLDNIICVAALDQDYSLWNSSNYGDVAVDVGAPGVNIRSTIPGPRVDGDFSSWAGIGSSSWDVDSESLNFDLLVNPSDWWSGGLYANGFDARAYREFDLSDSIAAGYTYSVDFALADPDDKFQVWRETGSAPADPFDDGSIDAEAVGADSNVVSVATSAADCAGKDCSIGVRLLTDASDTARGVALWSFTLRKVVDGTNETDFLSGTSMAAPHVTGIAALAWSVVPDKDYGEIRDAVLAGDEVMALDSNTTTGRAADAFKAIQEANDPPVAQNESVATDENTSIDVAITATDANGHSLDYSVATMPSHGTLDLSGNTATYTPGHGYSGSDSFEIETDDGFTGSDIATVSVAVDEGNDSDGDGGSGGGGSTGLLLQLGLLLLVLARASGNAVRGSRSRGVMTASS